MTSMRNRMQVSIPSGKGPANCLSEEFLCQLFACEIQIGSHIREDFGKSAHPQLFMGGNRYMGFPALALGGDTHVAARLARQFVTVTAQRLCKFFPAEIARKLQAGMTSSFTMCKRMTRGLSASSKWEETASRIIAFSSSRESACVKMEKPRARASYPPSGDSSMLKMISLWAMAESAPTLYDFCGDEFFESEGRPLRSLRLRSGRAVPQNRPRRGIRGARAERSFVVALLRMTILTGWSEGGGDGGAGGGENGGHLRLGKGQEAFDDHGVELRAGGNGQAAHGLLEGKPRAVRPGRDHGVKRVNHRNDARNDGNLGGLQTGGIAGAVEVFVVMEDVQSGALKARQHTQHGPAIFGMLLHQGVFLRVELRWLAQNRIRNPHFADVMQERGNFQILKLFLLEAEFLAHTHAPFGETRAVDAGVEILQIEKLIEGADDRTAQRGNAFFEFLDAQRLR